MPGIYVFIFIPIPIHSYTTLIAVITFWCKWPSSTFESSVWVIFTIVLLQVLGLEKATTFSAMLSIIQPRCLFLLFSPALTCWSWRKWCRRWPGSRLQMKWQLSSWKPWPEENSSKQRYSNPEPQCALKKLFLSDWRKGFFRM